MYQSIILKMMRDFQMFQLIYLLYCLSCRSQLGFDFGVLVLSASFGVLVLSARFHVLESFQRTILVYQLFSYKAFLFQIMINFHPYLLITDQDFLTQLTNAFFSLFQFHVHFRSDYLKALAISQKPNNSSYQKTLTVSFQFTHEQKVLIFAHEQTIFRSNLKHPGYFNQMYLPTYIKYGHSLITLFFFECFRFGSCCFVLLRWIINTQSTSILQFTLSNYAEYQYIYNNFLIQNSRLFSPFAF